MASASSSYTGIINSLITPVQLEKLVPRRIIISVLVYSGLVARYRTQGWWYSRYIEAKGDTKILLFDQVSQFGPPIVLAHGGIHRVETVRAGPLEPQNRGGGGGLCFPFLFQQTLSLFSISKTKQGVFCPLWTYCLYVWLEPFFLHHLLNKLKNIAPPPIHTHTRYPMVRPWHWAGQGVNMVPDSCSKQRTSRAFQLFGEIACLVGASDVIARKDWRPGGRGGGVCSGNIGRLTAKISVKY